MTSRYKVFAVVVLWCKLVYAGKNGDVYYVAEFSDDVVSCPGFENNVLKCEDLRVDMLSGENMDGVLGLNGVIKVMKEIEMGHEMNVKVWKYLEIGKEFLYNARGDICSSLTNEEAPWYPMMKSMNCTSCPIPVNTFEIKDMQVSLDYAQDVMCHEFCGEYEVEMSIMNELEQLSCYILQVSITERKADE